MDIAPSSLHNSRATRPSQLAIRIGSSFDFQFQSHDSIVLGSIYCLLFLRSQTFTSIEQDDHCGSAHYMANLADAGHYAEVSNDRRIDVRMVLDIDLHFMLVLDDALPDGSRNCKEMECNMCSAFCRICKPHWVGSGGEIERWIYSFTLIVHQCPAQHVVFF